MMMAVVLNKNRRLEISIFKNIRRNMVIEVVFFPEII